MTEYRFRELVDHGWLLVNDGHRAKIDELTGGGAAFLRAGALRDDGFRWEGLDSFAVEAKIENKRGRPGDVVITTKGNSVGRVGWVPESAPDFVYSPHLSFWRSLDDSRILPRYLYYWSRSDVFTVQLRGYAFATDMAPYFSLRDQLDLRIDLPSGEEQRRIAGVLGALDDLIDTNRQLQKLLAEVQFARYRDAVGDSASMVALDACTEFHNRARIPLSKAEREEMPGPYPYYGATGIVDTVGRYLFDGVHILVGEDGSVVNDDGSPVVQMVWGKYWVNNHAHVLSGKGISDGLLRQALIESNVGSLVTGAVQAKLSMGRLKTLELAIPNNSSVGSALDRLASAERDLADECLFLSRTRDELLPLLVSGRVRVRDLAGAVA